MKRSSSKGHSFKGPGLFASVSVPDLIFYIDGGSRGNPGPAGYGVAIQDGTGKPVDTLSRSIGTATNNVAEYNALLAALNYAIEKNAQRIQIYCDSELVVRQMQGRYRVQSPDLLPLYRQARSIADGLERFTITHVPREKNRLADELANQAMDAAMGQTRSALPPPTASPTVQFTEQSLVAIYEDGMLRPLRPAPALEEGAEYDVRLRKRSQR